MPKRSEEPSGVEQDRNRESGAEQLPGAGDGEGEKRGEAGLCLRVGKSSERSSLNETAAPGDGASNSLHLTSARHQLDERPLSRVVRS